jgi:endogenous inhibitor of DNA gyrase (YacG/DUF329 family)
MTGNGAVVFGGECPRCGRYATQGFPYVSEFLESPEVRLSCAECAHPVLAEKLTAP